MKGPEGLQVKDLELRCTHTTGLWVPRSDSPPLWYACLVLSYFTSLYVLRSYIS